MKDETWREVSCIFRGEVAEILKAALANSDTRFVAVLRKAFDIGRDEGRREGIEEAAIDIESRGPQGFVFAERIRRLK